MKLTALSLLAAASFGISASAQIQLAPGASFTFQFDTLPFLGTVSSAPFQGLGSAAYYLNPASGTPGASLITLEMFENSTSQATIGGAIAGQFAGSSVLGVILRVKTSH